MIQNSESKYTHHDRTTIKRWFGNLEVVEAEKELRIQPNEDDVKTATQGDPRNCVFSRFCQRAFSSTAVVFFGTIAYIDLLDKDGIRRVERFRINEEGKRQIRKWDSGGRFDLKGFVLLPPSFSKTAKAKSLESKNARKALLKGRSTGSSAKRPKRKPTAHRLSVFRNGIGMAQFPQARSEQ